ncbi:MAG: N-acetylneuraminate synthase family protein [Bacteroidetes bacterium]|nr:N-acetylneuraminate synthase family protein [Bacteroidota bacterium]
MTRPVLIAECCQNHNGDKENLKKMIHSAAENGADYVKIQAIRSAELTHRERFDEGAIDANGIVQTIKRPYTPEFERLKQLDLSLDLEKWFVDECIAAGIAPMTTVFTWGSLYEVKDLGYEAVKVASYDCASFPLLAELKKHWSTIFVSTGATFDNEIAQAASIMQGVNWHFLHCVTIYPTPLNDLHLSRMNFLRKFNDKVGYSDHSKPAETKLWASKLSLALGASCVERHYTILDSDKSKDGPVSITPAMLKELREFADMPRRDRMEAIKHEYPNWQEALGSERRELTHAELLNRDYYRGRFASKKDGKTIYNWEQW